MKLVIATCDKNNWILPKFWHMLHKFWAGCPYSAVVVGGLSTPTTFNADIFRGDDSSWASLLLAYLREQRDDAHILLTLDDCLLGDYIDQGKIDACSQIMQDHKDVMLLRLNPCPGPTLPWDSSYPDVGQINKAEDPYLTSVLPSIWRVAHLKRVLVPGEDAWSTEIAGTTRCRSLPGILLASRNTLMPHVNYLRHGKVAPEAEKEIEAKW